MTYIVYLPVSSSGRCPRARLHNKPITITFVVFLVCFGIKYDVGFDSSEKTWSGFCPSRFLLEIFWRVYLSLLLCRGAVYVTRFLVTQ